MLQLQIFAKWETSLLEEESKLQFLPQPVPLVWVNDGCFDPTGSCGIVLMGDDTVSAKGDTKGFDVGKLVI